MKYFFILLIIFHSQYIWSMSYFEIHGESHTTLPFSSLASYQSGLALYDNPSSLLHQPNQFHIGLAYFAHNLSINSDYQRVVTKIPDSIYLARQLNQDGSDSPLSIHPFATSDLPNAKNSLSPSTTQTSLQVTFSYQIIKSKLALGFMTLIPLKHFQQITAFYNDEREQYFSNSLQFELLGDRLASSLFFLGLAYAPVSWGTIAVGLNLQNSSQAITQVYLEDVMEMEQAVINGDVAIDSSFSPYFNMAIYPTSHWQISASLYLSSYSDFHGEAQVRLWNYEYADQDSNYLPQPFSFIYNYLPMRIKTGLSYTWILQNNATLIVAGTLKYSHWSHYLDRQNNEPLDTWYNTISGSLGTTYISDSWNIGIDSSITPSPIPLQIGRTNYVDNTRLALSFVLQRTIAFHNKTAIQIGITMQWHHLFSRHNTKSENAEHPVIDEFPTSINGTTGEIMLESEGLQSNNPGYPGFTSKGALWFGNLYIKLLIPNVLRGET